jgi:serine/threonine protein phosphatase PrpC
MREDGDALVIAVADGAGGTSHGGAAAQAVIDDVMTAEASRNADDWVARLIALDLDSARLGHGQTTAIVMVVTADRIIGACIGDSGAWRICGDQKIEDLSAHQVRKPLLGDGGDPRAISAAGLAPEETLLVASDGLLRYAPPPDIARLASNDDLESATAALVERVRLRSGELPDDVAIVLCRASR